MSVQISYKKQTLFGFLLLLCLLSVIEISMRVYDHYAPNCQFIESEVFGEMSFELKRQICNDNDKLVWNNNPLYLIPNQHFSTININSHGFRGDELQNNPDYRIFVMGGSTAFGVGATSDDATIPSYLQQKISEDFNKYNIEVINAGIPQAFSFTEKNLIKDKLLDYDPDLLIIYGGWNDIDTDYDNYERDGGDNFEDQMIRKIRQTDMVTLNVLMKLYFSYKHDTIDVIPFDSYKIKEKVSLWKNSWRDICELQEKYDFNTAIILQPLLGTGNKSLSLEEQTNLLHYDSNRRNQYYGLYADALNELDSTCTLVQDLRNVFDSHSETMYYDSGHVGNKGNEIIAEQIYTEIIPFIKEHTQ